MLILLPALKVAIIRKNDFNQLIFSRRNTVVDRTREKNCAPLRSSPLGVAPSALGMCHAFITFYYWHLKKAYSSGYRTAVAAENQCWKCFCVKMWMVWKKSQFSGISRNAVINCTWGKLQIYFPFYSRGCNCKRKMVWGQGGVYETKLNG